jgi:AsmA family protein
MSVTGRRGLRYGAIAAVVLAALALLVVFFPWNALRGPLASYLGHRLHREVAINGDLHVRLGFPTRVEVDDFSIANAQWSDLQPMAHAARIALTFDLPSLFHFTPDTIRLIEPRVVLEKNQAGEANWRFGGKGSGAPAFGDISIDNGTLRYRDPTLRGDITIAVHTVTSRENTPDELRFDGRGTLRGDPFTITGGGHGVSALRRVNDPYQLAFDLRAGATGIAFDGTIVPAAPEDIRGALRLHGPDLSQLYPLVPSPLPWTPPYTLAGDLTHANDRWNLQRIKGTVGESDLTGEFALDMSRPRAATIADLTSRRFDYKDLGGFIGLPPGEPGQKAKTPEQRKELQKRSTSSRVLPDKPFDLGKLRQHDVDLRFRGASVKWGRFPLDNLVAHVVLKDGVLRSDPLDFGVADGHVVTNLTLDLTQREPAAKAQIEIRRVELKRIFPQLAAPSGSAGRFGGRAQFSATGNSVADLLASMQGEAAIAMRGGEMSTLQLVLTNLDLARAAALLMRGGDEKAEIHCAITAMHATRGRLVPDLMVVDSSDELIHGTGSIDFRNEKYDVALKADSKKPSLVALRGPIMISGTFATPVVRPAAGEAVARIGAAVGLGVLAPPLALLPLIDLGNAPDADCRALYQDAQLASGTKAQSPGTRGGDGRAERKSKSQENVARSR